MGQTKFNCIYLFLCLFISSVVSGEENWSALATKYYNEQNWTESIKAYQHLLDQSAELSPATKEQAWYRVANAHIQLGQGKQAIKANKHLSKATQIPPSLVLYQKAQGLNLLGDEKDMWQTMKEMTASGYANLNELKTNPMWQKYQTTDSFKHILKQTDANLRPCMYDDKYQQFDFWLGHWEVYGNIEKTGPLFGHNTISKTERGCLIMEQWQGASGSTGTSMNYYDGILNQWVQRWVSGGGTVIDYAGGLVTQQKDKKSMQLVGKIYYAATQQQPQVRDFRGTWTPLEGGVVQQFFEESVDGGKSWYTWFNGYYFPVKEDKEDEE